MNIRDLMYTGERNMSQYTKVMTALIEMYRNMSFMWDHTHPDYTKRSLRLQAYKQLLAKYQELDDSASLPIVKAKLDNMRNSYIRELKKVRASRQSASDPSEVYTPLLWYYNKLSFLEGTVLKKKQRHTDEDESADVSIAQVFFDEDDEGSQSNTEYDRFQTEYLEPTEDSDSYSEAATERFHGRDTDIPLIKTEPSEITTSRQRKSKKESDWEVIGRAIGLQLRDVDSDQAIVAHKLIADIIYNAKLGRLSEDSKLSVSRSDRC